MLLRPSSSLLPLLLLRQRVVFAGTLPRRVARRVCSTAATPHPMPRSAQHHPAVPQSSVPHHAFLRTMLASVAQRNLSFTGRASARSSPDQQESVPEAETTSAHVEPSTSSSSPSHHHHQQPESIVDGLSDPESITLDEKAFIQVIPTTQSVRDLEFLIVAFKESQPGHSHVKFVNAVLDHLDVLGSDVDVHFYNHLLNVFPAKNSFKTKNWLDAVWPKPTLQSDAAEKVLCRMEDEGVVPNLYTHELVEMVFGKASQPIKKVRSMIYWMTKVLDENPFSITLLGDNEPTNETQFAKYAAERMGGFTKYTREDGLQYLVDQGSKDVVGETPAGEAFGLWGAMNPEQCAQLHMFMRSGLRVAVKGPHHCWMAGVRRYHLTLETVVTSTQTTDQYVLGTATVYDPSFDSSISKDLTYFQNESLWTAAAELWRQEIIARAEEAFREQPSLTTATHSQQLSTRDDTMSLQDLIQVKLDFAPLHVDHEYSETLLREQEYIYDDDFGCDDEADAANADDDRSRSEQSTSQHAKR